MLRVRMARCVVPPRLGWHGYVLRKAAVPSGVRFRKAAMWMSSPSNLKTALNRASHRRSALAAMVSNTGWASVRELLMTRRISLVAACCSNASAKRCSSSRPVEPSAVRDFLTAGRLASILAFAGFAARSIAPPCHSRRYNSAAIDNSLREDAFVRLMNHLTLPREQRLRDGGGDGLHRECGKS